MNLATCRTTEISSQTAALTEVAWVNHKKRKQEASVQNASQVLDWQLQETVVCERNGTLDFFCKTINLQNVAPEQQLLKMGLSSNLIKNHYLFMILLILNCLLQNFWSSFSVKKKIKAFCAAQTILCCFRFSNNSYRNCSVWIIFLMWMLLLPKAATPYPGEQALCAIQNSITRWKPGAHSHSWSWVLLHCCFTSCLSLHT